MARAKVVLSVIDGLGSFTALDRQLEAICWTHRGEGWSVHDWRGVGRGQAVRTKREAERLVREWARMGPALGPCKWFAACTNEATHLEPHPVLGEVPACDRCVKIGAPVVAA